MIASWIFFFIVGYLIGSLMGFILFPVIMFSKIKKLIKSSIGGILQ